MRADLEALFVEGVGAGSGGGFEGGALAAFVEGLHPEGFGDVGDGFGQAVEGGGARVEPGSQLFPPSVEEGVDGVRGAGAEALADLFNCWALAVPQELVGGAFDVAGGDAAGPGAELPGRFGHVTYDTPYMCCIIKYARYIDNCTYHL